MDRAPQRTSLPLLLAVAGFALSVALPGSLLPAAVLLFCPGWGLLRLLSTVDRAFFVAGASLCASMLVLAGLTLLGWRQHWSPQHLALATHGTAIILCTLGRLRMARHDRWQASQPTHPAPMPLWPERWGLCLSILTITLVAAAFIIDPLRPSSQGQIFSAALAARGWLTDPGPAVTLTGVFGSGELQAAAAAALGAACDLHTLITTVLLSLSALAACLLLVAESICRLWGNRGGPGAMAALLLGLNPLAGLALLSAESGTPWSARLANSPGRESLTALRPFINGAPLALTLAFSALLLSASLSILRRSSRDMPRLVTLASLGLVLADSRAAWLLLPGWILGLAWSHGAGRRHPDAALRRGGSGRRNDEPCYLRAPFWRPALHLVLGAALASPLVLWPSLHWSPSRLTAWMLITTVLPGGLLFLPGVRHLNASPGREAYFFLGLLGGATTLGLVLDSGPPMTAPLCSLLALIVAVPASVGALKLVERYGLGAQLALTVLVATLAVGPAIWLGEARARQRPLTVLDESRVSAPALDLDLRQALAQVAAEAPPDAVLFIPQELQPDEWQTCRLLVGRTLLQDLGDDEALVLASGLSSAGPLAGDGARFEQGALALTRLRGRPRLAGRELWVIASGPLWPGFQLLPAPGATSTGPSRLAVSRARPPDVVLLTISSLRADRLTKERMPHLRARADRGLRFDTALTPLPATLPGLGTLLTGLDPIDHGLRSSQGSLAAEAPRLAQAFAARGYRTAAVVSLSGGHGLLEGFQSVLARPHAHHDAMVAAARRQLASADRRPLFLWVHLSDLELPYDVPADARSEATGAFSFPPSADPARTQYGVAAFPPSPAPHRETRLVDVATGMAQYDALVTLLDQALARLFDSIPEDDLLVVTAPQGTSLDEHDAWFLSGPDLFEPSIHVPLILVGAGLPRGRRSELTGLQDVAALLLQGELPARQRIQLESDWRPGLATGRAYDPLIDPTCRGAARRIWGERTLTAKTLLTVPPTAERAAAGLSFDLTRDLEETRAHPADPFVLRRINAWREQGHVPRIDQ